MRKWRYIEPSPDMKPIETLMTEADIIREYYAFWVKLMQKAGAPAHLITHQNCIDDFVVIHWAEEVHA